jgi:hypothetical protein
MPVAIDHPNVAKTATASGTYDLGTTTFDKTTDRCYLEDLVTGEEFDYTSLDLKKDGTWTAQFNHNIRGAYRVKVQFTENISGEKRPCGAWSDHFGKE